MGYEGYLVRQKYTGLLKIKNSLSAPKMKKPLDLSWDKEFEDNLEVSDIYEENGDELRLQKNCLMELFEKYFNFTYSKRNEYDFKIPVRIKIKKNCIQIERII